MISIGSTMNQNWKRRATFVFLTMSTSVAVLPANPCVAGGNSHGPIYKTLDAFAGGIEKVIDVAASMRRRASKCDELSCDDGCDAATLSAMGSSVPKESLKMVPPSEAPTHRMPHFDAVPMPPPLPSLPPTPSSPPKSLPGPMKPMPVPVPESAEPRVDEWYDGISTAPDGTKAGSGQVPIRTDRRPPQRRPSGTYDSLPNPFEDDPQSFKQPKSLNQPASYWEPW